MHFLSFRLRMQTMGGSILLNPGAPSHGAGGMFPGTIHPLSIVFSFFPWRETRLPALCKPEGGILLWSVYAILIVVSVEQIAQAA